MNRAEQRLIARVRGKLPDPLPCPGFSVKTAIARMIRVEGALAEHGRALGSRLLRRLRGRINAARRSDPWKRFGERPGRGAALALTIGVLLLLASQIVAKTMARSVEISDPQRALAFDPHRGTALLELARHRLSTLEHAADEDRGQKSGHIVRKRPSKADLAVAQDLVERALRFDPLTPRALTDLGRIAAMEGHARRASALMELAAKRALRDSFAQAWVVNDALRRGDFAGALARLDAMVRAEPGSFGKALPLLAAFVARPRAEAPLVRLLERNPPWRASFLADLPSRVADSDALRRFYAALRAGPRPPSERELQPYIDRLVSDGQFEEAHAVWKEALPPSRRPTADAMLYNAGFQYPLSGSEFDWRIVHELGADIGIDGEAGEERILRIEFSGARVDFDNVSHLLLLKPGVYRLTGEVKAQELHTERGLWWRLFCAGPKGVSLGETALVAESMPWRRFALTFSVPAESCRAQVLRLELPARVALEKRIEGVVLYRDLAMTALRDPADGGDISISAAAP